MNSKKIMYGLVYSLFIGVFLYVFVFDSFLISSGIGLVVVFSIHLFLWFKSSRSLTLVDDNVVKDWNRKLNRSDFLFMISEVDDVKRADRYVPISKLENAAINKDFVNPVEYALSSGKFQRVLVVAEYEKLKYQINYIMFIQSFVGDDRVSFFTVHDYKVKSVTSEELLSTLKQPDLFY